MICEVRQEQVSALLDGESDGSEEEALFRHLGECSECRRFLASAIRIHKAAARDRAEILLTADPLPPVRSWPREEAAPAAVRKGRRVEADAPERRRFPAGLLSGGWRVPVPLAVGLSVILLAAGGLIAGHIHAVSGDGGARWRMGASEPRVVVVCGLPEVEVRAMPQELPR